MRLASRSHALSLLALLSQLLTLALQCLVARRFGVTGLVDAWIAAQALPALAATAVTALAGQLVLPALGAAEARGGEAARERACGELLVVLGGIGFVLGLLLALLPEAALRLAAPGLAAPVRHEAEGLLRWIAAGLLPVGASAVLVQAAQARGRFLAAAALSPLGALVPVTAFLAAPAGSALHAMVVAQALLAFALLPAHLALAGLPLRRVLARLSRTSLDLLWRAAPVLLVVASSRVNLAVDAWFASSLPEGSLAVLGYATRAVAVVQVVLAAPVASVVFARLSRDAARGDWEAFASSAGRATERAFFLAVGAALLLVAAGERAATLLLGPGAGPDATASLAACFAALSGIVVFGPWGSILARACLASRRDGVALLFLGVVPMLLNALLDALLVGRFGVVGLAAVTSLNAAIGLPIVHAVLRRRGVLDAPPWGPLLRFVACALPPSAALLLAPLPAGPSGLGQAGLLATFGAGALAAYALLVHLSGGRLGRLLRDD
jgi:putative peptidoglycan lipid II flippase